MAMVSALALATAACVETPEPQKTTRLAAVSAGQVIRTEDVTVHATFAAYLNIRVLRGVNCVFTRGRQRLEITTPEKITLEITAGRQPAIEVECDYMLGARIRTVSTTQEPEIKNVTADLSAEERVYSDTVSVLFTQQ